MIDPKFRPQQSSSISPQAKPLGQPDVSAQSSVANVVSEDEVRIHAYELYERRGNTEDRALEDWLKAEDHLAARKNRANKTTAS
jgi:hypothetical protein